MKKRKLVLTSTTIRRLSGPELKGIAAAARFTDPSEICESVNPAMCGYTVYAPCCENTSRDPRDTFICRDTFVIC